MTTATPNHALQRTRPSRSGCSRCLSRAGSLTLGRYPAYVKHSEAAPEWYGCCTGVSLGWHPFHVRAIMLEQNNRPFIGKPVKLQYMWRDVLNLFKFGIASGCP